MKDPSFLTICATKAGRFKVYVLGQHDDHLMDWAGMNYRFAPVTGQPRLGHTTYEEAEAVMETINKDKPRLQRELTLARGTGGSYFPEERRYGRCYCCNAVKTGEIAYCSDCVPPYGMGPNSCAKHRRKQ